MTVSGDPHSDPWLELLVDAVERCGNGSGQSVDEVRAELTASHPHLLPRFEQMLNASRQTSPLDLPMFRQPDVDPGGWPSGHRVGPWQIESLAGRGGMGEVYLARRADGAFERSVAIKRVARGNSGFDARFATERVLLARLDHPAIARLIDGGVDDQGQPYLVMEWVDGTGLPEWLRQPHPLSTRLDLLACLAEALIAAHRSLVVHRDLKPANVRVTSADLPKLLDFGIAKLLDDPEQDAGTTLGLFSPQYAAPEQLLGGGVSTLTDVHGFGLVMYEVLSGQPAFPHAARSLADRVRAICEQDPVLPSVAARSSTLPYPPRLLAGDLDAITRRCLAKQPAARYAGMAEVLADLERHRHHRPVKARQGRWRYRSRLWLRRNWLAALLGGMVALALLLGLALTGWQARIASSERDQAHSETAMQEALREHFMLVLNEAANADGASAREVLDASIVGIENQYPRSPALRQNLMLALADVYFHIGDYLTTRQLLEKLQVTGDDPAAHLRRLKVGLQTALVLIPLGELDAADRELHTVEAALAGVATARALKAEIGMARAQWWRAKGEFALGLAEQESAVAELRRAPEVTPRALGTAIANLATAYLQTGQLAAAETEYQRALAIFHDAELPINSSLPVVLTNLGHLAAWRGEPDLALARYDEALAATLQSATRTPAHAALLNARARALLVLDRADEGVPLAQEAESILLQRVGAQSPDRLGILVTLADLALAGEDLAGAGKYLDLAQQIAHAGLPEAHPLRLRLELSMAMRQRALGQTEAAATAFQRIGLALAEGPVTLRQSAARAEILLAETKADANQPAAAESALLRAQQILAALQPVQGVDRLESACRLAILQQDRPAVAAHCIQLRAILGAGHSRLKRLATMMSGIGGPL